MNTSWFWIVAGAMTGAAQLYSLVRSVKASPSASFVAAPLRLLVVAACLLIAGWFGQLLPAVVGWVIALGCGLPFVLKVVSWK